MDAIENELARLRKTATYDRCIADVDSIIEYLESVRDGSNNETTTPTIDSNELHKRTSHFIKQLKGHEKEVHGGLSRYGKVLDKTFKNAFKADENNTSVQSATTSKGLPLREPPTSVTPPQLMSSGGRAPADATTTLRASTIRFGELDQHLDASGNLSTAMDEDNVQDDDDEDEDESQGANAWVMSDDSAVGSWKASRSTINRAVLMHLERTGQFEVGSTFQQEANVELAEQLMQEFESLYTILQAMSNQDLSPAIAWTKGKRNILLNRGSTLEFVLHKLEFFRLLFDESQPVRSRELSALWYAREHLALFGDRYLDEIAQLMTSVLYVSNFGACPYADELQKPTYEQVHDQFASEFCSVLGLPPQSPLVLAVTAGFIAQPIVTRMKNVIKRRGAEWTTTTELPVSIDLPSEFQFHSIFVCPVSKEQTTEANPPLMLPCGHVLATESIRSLGKGQFTKKFKCPYCPKETCLNEALRVYF